MQGRHVFTSNVWVQLWDGAAPGREAPQPSTKKKTHHCHRPWGGLAAPLFTVEVAATWLSAASRLRSVRLVTGYVQSPWQCLPLTLRGFAVPAGWPKEVFEPATGMLCLRIPQSNVRAASGLTLAAHA